MSILMSDELKLPQLQPKLVITTTFLGFQRKGCYNQVLLHGSNNIWDQNVAVARDGCFGRETPPREVESIMKHQTCMSRALKA